MLTNKQIQTFNQNGFVVKKKLFTRQEIEKLKQQIDSDRLEGVIRNPSVFIGTV